MGYGNDMGGWATARVPSRAVLVPRKGARRVAVKVRPRPGLMAQPRALNGYAGYGDYSGLFSFVGKAVKAVGKAVGSVAKVAAPVVGTVIGGPVGGLVGKGVASVLSGKPKVPAVVATPPLMPVATPPLMPVATPPTATPTTRRATVTLPGGRQITLPKLPQVVTDVASALATPASASAPAPVVSGPFPVAEAPAPTGDGKILGLPPLAFGALAAGAVLLLLQRRR